MAHLDEESSNQPVDAEALFETLEQWNTELERFVNSKERDPANFSLAEWQQAKRGGHDPKALKQMFQELWGTSDSGKRSLPCCSREATCSPRGIGVVMSPWTIAARFTQSRATPEPRQKMFASVLAMRWPFPPLVRQRLGTRNE